jgi:LysR family transcriptional regulator (chromosome initiation inhibitor)
LAAQIALLESEALAEMGGGRGGTHPRGAGGDADSTSTWFTAFLATLPHALFDIRIEDHDRPARLLREGAILGAVTAERTSVSGCRNQSLGAMRYVPVASPWFVARHLPDGFTAVAMATAPSLAWSREDALQTCRCAKPFAGPSFAAGASLADVRIADAHLDVLLFWQCWKLDSPSPTRCGPPPLIFVDLDGSRLEIIVRPAPRGYIGSSNERCLTLEVHRRLMWQPPDRDQQTPVP